MWTAYTYAELRDSGDLVLPLPGIAIPLGGTLGTAPALLLALLAAAGIGITLHLLVFRPLRTAPALATLVASIGVMVVLQALAVLRFGSANRFVEPLLPNRPVTVLDVSLPLDRLLLGLLAVAAAAVLSLVMGRTRVGLATRATAEDREATALLGWSPDLLAGGSWVVASVLAGLAGVLVAPVTALNPLTYSLFVVPALAAALVGRLDSFGLAVAAALALGMVQSELVQLQTELDWLARLNLRAALPFVVVVVVMVVRGQLVPTRATPPAARLPVVGRPRHPAAWAAAGLASAGGLLLVVPEAYRLGLVRSLVGALACLSVVLLTGYVGQLSVAPMAFAGVAGFALSRLQDGWGLPFPVAPLLASAAAAGGGLLLGLAARRVRGIDLAVLTLAAGVAVDEIVFRNPALTGGLGGSTVPPPSVLGVDLGPDADGPPLLVFGLLAAAVLAACALAVARLRGGALGRRMLAVRANERAAGAAGVDVPRTKVTAFVLSAALAGLSGALLGYSQGRLTYEGFGVFVSLSVVAVAYLGGVASIAGALVGGLLVPGGVLAVVLDDTAGLRSEYQLLASGLALVAIAVLAPEGLTGLARRVSGRSAG
jgi:branched-chain amino acid transport system permease protein